MAGLYDIFSFLAAKPRVVRERVEIVAPVRVHPYQSHLVIYEIDGLDVVVLRVRHGHEDWQSAPI